MSEQYAILDFYETLGGTALSLSPPCQSCPQVHWLVCQQTILQERHTEGEQINSDPQILCQMLFM